MAQFGDSPLNICHFLVIVTAEEDYIEASKDAKLSQMFQIWQEPQGFHGLTVKYNTQ